MRPRPAARGLALLGACLGALAAAPSAAADCPTCVPLDDLAGPPHAGFPPGLYPGGMNSPPAAHLALALEEAAGVVPRDAGGAPDPAGLVGWIAVGMSNTNQEFAAFERREDLRAGRNARLIVVDTAVGGQSADVISNPAAPYWTIVAQRVAAAGLDPDQVQVAWLKEADGSVPDTSFPSHALTLQSHLRSIVRHLRDTYPNLRLCYLSSRIYGGYATSPERGEPLSYETGFAVRWLIEDQIGGDPGLNADADLGAVEAPVLLWGPYLWANGATPRASDGLAWLAGDLESDRVHPSPSGEQKVAGLLETFLAAETTAAGWRDAAPGESWQALTAIADAYVDDAQPAMNFGAAPVIGWRNPSVRSFLLFDLPAAGDSVFHAKLSFVVPPEPQIQGVQAMGVSDTGWSELSITAATAPAMDGGLLGTIPSGSRGTAVSLDVTDAVRGAAAAGAARIAFGLRWLAGSGPMQTVGSRESADPPRLLLGTAGAATSVAAVASTGFGLEIEPNPASGAARVLLELAHAPAEVAIEVFDVRGRRVRTLFAGTVPEGARSLRVSWDGADSRGGPAPGGIYLVRARAGGAALTRKLLLAR